MFKRNIESALLEWNQKKIRKPLILQGARQVGKTHLLLHFGKSHFSKCHYFDLESSKDQIADIFTSSNLSPHQILEALSFYSGQPIDLERDILFLDEIQAIPRALTSLKYFNQDLKDFPVIASGSNLGVSHSDEPFPVGKVELHFMYPMTFEEFLEALGETKSLDFIRSYQGAPILDVFHQHLFKLLKVYFVTGGMPEVIETYQEYKESPLDAFQRVRLVQKQLLLHYERDFHKYAGATNSRHIHRIFESVPGQLSSPVDEHSKKYKFKDVVSKGKRPYSDLADPIHWLEKAGLIFKIHTCEHPLVPLNTHISENSFKLMLFDVGLLGCMTHLSPEQILQYDYGSFKGYFAENYVLQELWTSGYTNLVTWSGRNSEIEFVLERNGSIIPIEVKAGTNNKARSLSAFITKYNPPCGVKFSGMKYGFSEKNKTYTIPLYLVSKFTSLIE